MANIKDLMGKKIISADPSMSLQEISKILISNKLSGLPVVEKSKKKLVGFISERDIIIALSRGLVADKKVKVKDVMNKKVVSVEEKDLLEKASEIFTENPYRYLPVTKNKKLVGIISRKDVINKLMHHYY